MHKIMYMCMWKVCQLAYSLYIIIYVCIEQVIDHYYMYLESHMDSDSVSHMMHCNHLISNADYEAITSAPSDHKMNTILLQYIRSMDVNTLFKFIDILWSIETQISIGNCLKLC